MIRSARIVSLPIAVSAAGWLRVVLICGLVLSLMLTMAPVIAEHALSHPDFSDELIEPVPDSGDSDLGPQGDCLQDPGCHPPAVLVDAALPMKQAAPTVFVEQRRLLLGIPAPPLQHPPTFS